MIIIDGSILEGGGQILRNSFLLSCLLGIHLRIKNIRGNRTKPGLFPQHLQGIQALAKIYDGILEGDHIGSLSVTFIPGSYSHSTFCVDTKTAGSITLLLQSLLPAVIYSKTEATSHLELRGGTNVDFAPTVDYFCLVFSPLIRRFFHMEYSLDLIRRGFYPKGHGAVMLHAQPFFYPAGPKWIPPLQLTDPGRLSTINVFSAVSALPLAIAERMNTEIRRIFRKELGTLNNISFITSDETSKSFGMGYYTIITATSTTECIFGHSNIGKRGLQAEDVASKAAYEMISTLNKHTCVDQYMQDQLIVYMALAKGLSKMVCGRPTLHTLTSIHIAEVLTDAKFSVSEITDTPLSLLSRKSTENSFLIECEGISYYPIE